MADIRDPWTSRLSQLQPLLPPAELQPAGSALPFFTMLQSAIPFKVLRVPGPAPECHRRAEATSVALRDVNDHLVAYKGVVSGSGHVPNFEHAFAGRCVEADYQVSWDQEQGVYLTAFPDGHCPFAL